MHKRKSRKRTRKLGRSRKRSRNLARSRNSHRNPKVRRSKKSKGGNPTAAARVASRLSRVGESGLSRVRASVAHAPRVSALAQAPSRVSALAKAAARSSSAVPQFGGPVAVKLPLPVVGRDGATLKDLLAVAELVAKKGARGISSAAGTHAHSGRSQQLVLATFGLATAVLADLKDHPKRLEHNKENVLEVINDFNDYNDSNDSDQNLEKLIALKKEAERALKANPQPEKEDHVYNNLQKLIQTATEVIELSPD